MVWSLLACTDNAKHATSEAIANVGGTPSEPVRTVPAKAENTSGDSITVDYLMGHFDPAKDPRFVRIKAEHGGAEAMYMRAEAYQSFVRMFEAAQKEGVVLRILSATRSFDRQRLIWEEKWTGKRLVDGEYLTGPATDPAERARRIMRWSSMPGTSRHHWGTDIDLNEMTNGYFAQGKGQKIYAWLTQHASEYGFCQVYSALGEARPNGYQEEKWHWSYLPLASGFTQKYKALITDKDIKGFKGAEAALEIRAVDFYALGINPDCAK